MPFRGTFCPNLSFWKAINIKAFSQVFINVFLLPTCIKEDFFAMKIVYCRTKAFYKKKTVSKGNSDSFRTAISKRFFTQETFKNAIHCTYTDSKLDSPLNKYADDLTLKVLISKLFSEIGSPKLFKQSRFPKMEYFQTSWLLQYFSYGTVTQL